MKPITTTNRKHITKFLRHFSSNAQNHSRIKIMNGKIYLPFSSFHKNLKQRERKKNYTDLHTQFLNMFVSFLLSKNAWTITGDDVRFVMNKIKNLHIDTYDT